MDAGDDSFQILSGNEEGKATGGTWNACASGTITVKGVYNLYNWTYDAEVSLDGTTAASMTAGRIGPSSWDKNDTCTPGSTYEKLSFVVQTGTAYVDNISVKAYKPKSDIMPQMTETSQAKRQGLWQIQRQKQALAHGWQTQSGGGGYQYAEYINSAGQTDIGIKADGAWNRLQYIPGVNFSKLYENNTGEITFGFDFVTPDNIADGKMIMEWGDGFTNKYQNIPFFCNYQS